MASLEQRPYNEKDPIQDKARHSQLGESILSPCNSKTLEQSRLSDFSDDAEDISHTVSKTCVYGFLVTQL